MNTTISFISFFLIIVQEFLERITNICHKIKYRRLITGFIIAFFTLILIITFSIFIHSGVKAEEKALLHKYYTVVTIEEGDSLWDYATEYGELGYKNRSEYIKEIQSINHLNNVNKLISGETIVLPYYSYELL